LWGRIQEIVRQSVPEHSFKTWIESASAVAATDGELILEAQNPFHVEWLEDKFGDLLHAAGEHVLGRPLKVSVRASATRPDSSQIPAVEFPPGADVSRPHASSGSAGSA